MVSCNVTVGAALLVAILGCSPDRTGEVSRDSPAVAPVDPSIRYPSQRAGARFDPSTIVPGTTVGALVLDSIRKEWAEVDSSYVGSAWFRGELTLTGVTIFNPDADLRDRLPCFEADSASAAAIPRWQHDARRSWFCLLPADSSSTLLPPSEGVRATVVVDRFAVHRNLSDAFNTARLLRVAAIDTTH